MLKCLKGELNKKKNRIEKIKPFLLYFQTKWRRLSLQLQWVTSTFIEEKHTCWTHSALMTFERFHFEPRNYILMTFLTCPLPLRSGLSSLWRVQRVSTCSCNKLQQKHGCGYYCIGNQPEVLWAIAAQSSGWRNRQAHHRNAAKTLCTSARASHQTLTGRVEPTSKMVLKQRTSWRNVCF